MNVRRSLTGAAFTLGVATALTAGLATGANAATVTPSCHVTGDAHTATATCPAISGFTQFRLALLCHDDVHDSDGPQGGAWHSLPGTAREQCSPTSFRIIGVAVQGR